MNYFKLSKGSKMVWRVFLFSVGLIISVIGVLIATFNL